MKVKDSFRKVVFSKLNQEQIDSFYKIYYKLRYPSEMQKRISGGTLNPDKIIYIIRPRVDGTEGLMSLYMNVIRNLFYAEQHGYTCVVDFKNYKTQYSDSDHPGSVNIWDLFFTQPSNIVLEDAYKSKNIIFSGLEIQLFRPDVLEVSFEKEHLKKLHEFIFSKVDFSEITRKKVSEEEQKLNLNYQTTLGLYLRGTDYTSLKPSGHPIQPTVNQACEKINELLLTHPGIERIFLVTEDNNIYKEIKYRYPDKCSIVSFDSFVKDYSGNHLLAHDKSVSELGTPYERGMNYLVKLIILSKCNYLICGNTMGSWSAAIFNGGIGNYIYAFDLGRYGK